MIIFSSILYLNQIKKIQTAIQKLLHFSVYVFISFKKVDTRSGSTGLNYFYYSITNVKLALRLFIRFCKI